MELRGDAMFRQLKIQDPTGYPRPDSDAGMQPSFRRFENSRKGQRRRAAQEFKIQDQTPIRPVRGDFRGAASDLARTACEISVL
jgi:hypothetical protein